MKTNLHIPNTDVIPFHTAQIRVEDLLSHLMVVGQPGSGKSRACIRILLRELLKLHAQDPARKTGIFLIDGKGGELRNYVEEALQMAGRADDLIVVGPKDWTFNPFGDPSWPEAKIANTIIEVINTVGSSSVRRSIDPFWDNATQDILSALVAVARNPIFAPQEPPRVLNVGHLVNLRPILSKKDRDIVTMAADLAVTLGPETGASFVEFAALPAATRHTVATSCGTILAPFARSPLKDVLVPAPGRPELDLTTILSEGKVVLFDLSDPENATELLPAAMLAKACFARMILSRRSMDINQTRPVFAILEEFQKVLTPQPDSAACEANWMDTCRWCGCGVILCTQGVSSLLTKAAPALVDKLVSLCATQMWLASSDPASAAYASRALPGKFSQQVQRTITKSLPPPLLFPRDGEVGYQTETEVVVQTREPVSLQDLKPGTIRLRMRDGSKQTIQADLSAA